MLTFALSFIVTALFWMSHHRWFQLVSAFDTTSLWINILLLCIAFLPFPTAVVARHGGTSAATAFPGGSIATTGVMASTMWFYMSRHKELLSSNRAPGLLYGHFLVSLGAPTVFALSVPLAYLDPGVAKFSWLLTYPAARLVRRLDRTHGPDR
jgi:uncharacterized membrane protein